MRGVGVRGHTCRMPGVLFEGGGSEGAHVSHARCGTMLLQPTCKEPWWYHAATACMHGTVVVPCCYSPLAMLVPQPCLSACVPGCACLPWLVQARGHGQQRGPAAHLDACCPGGGRAAAAAARRCCRVVHPHAAGLAKPGRSVGQTGGLGHHQHSRYVINHVFLFIFDLFKPPC